MVTDSSLGRIGMTFNIRSYCPMLFFQKWSRGLPLTGEERTEKMED